MRKIIILFLLIFTAVAGGYYHFFYSPIVYQRYAQRRLDQLSAASTTHNSAFLKDTLTQLLSDKASITLALQPAFSSGQEQVKPEIQEFSTPEFLSFIDTVLYGVKNYSARASIQTFTLAPDKKSAGLTFNVHALADDLTGMSITGNMHFTTDAACNAKMLFNELPQTPVLSRIFCKLQIQYSLNNPASRQ